MFVLTMSQFSDIQVRHIRVQLRRGETIVLRDSEHTPYAVIKSCRDGMEEFDEALSHKTSSHDDIKKIVFG